MTFDEIKYLYRYSIDDLTACDIRFRLTDSLIKLNTAIKHKRFSDIKTFHNKLIKHEALLVSQKSWYNEHINDTIEHYLAKLLCDLSIIVNRGMMNYKHDKFRLIGRSPRVVLTTDIRMLCLLLMKEGSLTGDFPLHIDYIINKLHTTKNSLTKYLETIELIIILTTSLNVDPNIFLKYYLLFSGGLKETKNLNGASILDKEITYSLK